MDDLESLDSLLNQGPDKVELQLLPSHMRATTYVKDKAYAVNELVREIHNDSYEWYGFLLAEKTNPELVIDIGIGKNRANEIAYTKIEPADIEQFWRTLPEQYFINGWIHSHGRLGLKTFSGTDDANNKVVLDYVTTGHMPTIRKDEIKIENISVTNHKKFLRDVKEESITVLFEGEHVPQKKPVLYQTIKGGFSYAIVIGDEGRHYQEVFRKERAMITGEQKILRIENARCDWEPTERVFGKQDREALKELVKENVQPPSRRPFRGYFNSLPEQNKTSFHHDAPDYNLFDFRETDEKEEQEQKPKTLNDLDDKEKGRDPSIHKPKKKK